MQYHFKNLIFEGGGVKGIAYVGAMEVLEQKAILKQIARVGGTSARLQNTGGNTLWLITTFVALQT